MWPVVRFSALAAKLLDQLCDEVPGAVSLIGKTEIGEMAALIEQADRFIGHDSGPFHVAVAVGTPALAICGRPDAEPEYLSYKREGVSVLIRENPGLISVDEVFMEATRLMGGLTEHKESNK